MENSPMRQQIASMRQSLFDEEILDNHYLQLEQLEDRDNPNFAEEVMTLYCRDSTKIIASLHQILVGANKIRNEVNLMREYVKEENIEKTKSAFQELQIQHDILRAKIEPYFQLLRQVGPIETAQRPK
ncbi:pseudo histidine-containing phosphotransfer protein 5 isoform X2 [Ziziphus jujuba]|uniref:Histidine-containing phosphotransfer protein n=1 Tax=Ziziphus jujuba TaxID=326968 RepID=A0ABM3I784_ZIZJJ|nr:pseudo histidine-containing phosphotransfer protein 5-like isoform X2 [Ziziphus jujuba var. spinosa]XP_048322033.1 pseudo histidine-containing phosphotransfer protein 5 isoform X2 [Ziziphus jujuba]XP_048323180.1 pseudo histidine-containing phosphotransfer protein 5-like isoform X2 [Ziziphus jujuba var. spinosa]